MMVTSRPVCGADFASTDVELLLQGQTAKPAMAETEPSRKARLPSVLRPEFPRESFLVMGFLYFPT
jgi:hypothetical protein